VAESALGTLSWCPTTTIETSRGSFFAIEAGEGPTVLFLHGVTANAYVWIPILDALRGEYHVVSIDQRGHGRTGCLGTDPLRDGTWNGESFVADLKAIAEALEVPFVIVGHSLGCRNAIAAGAGEIENVKGIVGIDFTPFIEPTVFDALAQRVVAGSAPQPDGDSVRAALSARYVNLPSDAIERRCEYGYRIERGEWHTLADPDAMAAICRGLSEDLVASLERLLVPTMLVRGGESLLVTPQAWEKTKQLRPDLPAVTVPGTDHYVPEEDPKAVASIVRSFFATYVADELQAALSFESSISQMDQENEEEVVTPAGDEKTPAQPINWSVAVEVKSSDKGKLSVKIPPQVAEALKVTEGDVICWTGFADGTVEVWSVPKSPYSTLYTEDK